MGSTDALLGKRGGFSGLVGLAQQAISARHVVFHGLGRDPEAPCDFIVGQVFDLAEQEDLPAAGRNAQKNLLESDHFLASGDDPLNRWLGADEVVEGNATLAVHPLVPTTADFIERQSTGDREEQQARFASPARVHRRLDSDKGVLRDVLRLGPVTKQTTQVGAERKDRRPVERTEIPRRI